MDVWVKRCSKMCIQWVYENYCKHHKTTIKDSISFSFSFSFHYHYYIDSTFFFFLLLRNQVSSEQIIYQTWHFMCMEIFFILFTLYVTTQTQYKGTQISEMSEISGPIATSEQNHVSSLVFVWNNTPQSKCETILHSLIVKQNSTVFLWNKTPQSKCEIILHIRFNTQLKLYKSKITIGTIIMR